MMKVLILIFIVSFQIHAKRYTPEICEETSLHMAKKGGWPGYNTIDFDRKRHLAMQRLSKFHRRLFPNLKDPNIKEIYKREQAEFNHNEKLLNEGKISDDEFLDLARISKLKSMRDALGYHQQKSLDNMPNVYPDHYVLANQWAPNLQDKYQDYLKASTVLSVPLCMLEFQSAGCAVALPRIIKEISPQIADNNKGHYSMVKSSIKIWSTHTYEQPILLLAQFMLDNLIRAQKGENIKSHFIKDVVKAFKLTGLSEEHAWEFIGNLSANWAMSHVMKAEDYPSITHLLSAYFIIAEAAFGIDAFTWNDQGRLYTLPEIVSTSCHWGKTYHFWMSAYLAYKQRNSGITKRGSVLASYLSGLLYEFMSPSAGRSVNKLFEEDTFSVHNNTIRLNLAFKAAAAIYGAEYTQKVIRNIDVDEILDQIFYYSEDTDYQMSDEFKGAKGDFGSGVYSKEIEHLAMKYQQAKKLPTAYFKFKKLFGVHPTVLER